MLNPRKTNICLSQTNKMLLDFKAPKSLSWCWNFGSLLGICLIMQIFSGLLLSFHYTNSDECAFLSIVHISDEVWQAWVLRSIHASGASFFFLVMFMHMGRGLYYGGYKMTSTWLMGALIFLVTMVVAFTGYVLPWGQMSFWGAAVITGLFSAIPQVGDLIVEWLWGGFSVGSVTLTRFFGFHFFLPFLVLALVMVHLIFLHQKGSSNPLGASSGMEKINFNPFYLYKDVVGVVLFLSFLLIVILIFPDVMGDVENFIEANPMSTPVHIQPEWYYLFAYAILRSVPNKLGGVLALFASVLVLFTVPFVKKKSSGGILSKMLFWSFVVVFVGLTWAGACPVESPYLGFAQVLTFLYFAYFSYRG